MFYFSFRLKWGEKNIINNNHFRLDHIHLCTNKIVKCVHHKMSFLTFFNGRSQQWQACVQPANVLMQPHAYSSQQGRVTQGTGCAEPRPSPLGGPNPRDVSWNLIMSAASVCPEDPLPSALREPSYSDCGLIWGLVRNANSQAPPKT